MSRVFAVKHKDSEIRKLSRSGGAFTAISDWILDRDGCVYGCRMDGFYRAIHSRADNAAERDEFRTSKYVESNLAERDVFKDAIEQLKTGRWVLFSGTSCQVSALLKITPVSLQEKLVTMDILCHGIPSARVWENYLQWFANSKKVEITNVIFRNKEKFGWADHTETIETKKRVYHNKYYRDLYSTHHIIRPACYLCPYKDYVHQSDFTIGDYWGIDKVKRDFNDNKGVSLVFLNSNIAEKIFEEVYDDLITFESDIHHCKQGVFIAPYSRPEGRDEFWQKYYEDGFSVVIKDYTTNPVVTSIKKILPPAVKKLLKNR